MKRLELNIQLFAATATITNARNGDYSIENNNEVQRLTFTVKRTSGTTYWSDNKTLTFKLTYTNNDGTTTTLTQTTQFNFPSGSVGATKSTYVDFTVPHKTDGTQNITYEASIATGTSVGTLHPTGSATLETIPRASSITVNDANIGSATNIVINKASSGFTTTLYYKASGQSNWTKIVDKTSNQVYGWIVPTSFYSLIPNSKTITCQFYAETYSGSTLVGTSSTVTATFTATGSPVINSSTLVDTNTTTTALTGDSSKMIRYCSNVKVTVNASAQNSASISSIKVNNTTASNGVVTFNSCSTNSFEIVVTDSRGYSTTITKTMTMVNYVILTLNATIVRNQPTDGIVKISYNGNYFNGSFGSQNNSLTVQYRYRVKDGTWGSWTNLSPTISGSTYSQSNFQISGFDYQKQYEFQIQAIDKTRIVPINGINISKGQPVFNWTDDKFNVNGDYYQNNTLLDNIYIKQSNTIDASKITISAFNSGRRVGNTMLYWSDSTTNSLSNFKSYVLGSNVSAGTTFFTCSFNGEHLSAIVEKHSSKYASFILYNYFKLNHYRYINGTWYDETIAKTSDIPTITNGSNSNGSWVKYSDGTMICRKTVTGTTNINVAWGNSYTTGASNTIDLGNYAQEFIDIPEVQITGHRGSSGQNFMIATLDETTKSYVGKTSLLRFTSAKNVSYKIFITAIGRWK